MTRKSSSATEKIACTRLVFRQQVHDLEDRHLAHSGVTQGLEMVHSVPHWKNARAHSPRHPNLYHVVAPEIYLFFYEIPFSRLATLDAFCKQASNSMHSSSLPGSGNMLSASMFLTLVPLETTF